MPSTRTRSAAARKSRKGNRLQRTQRPNYTIVVERETDPAFAGYYNVRVPALPGCLTYGRSLDEAVANAREAILAYLLTLKAERRSFPADSVYEARTISIEVSL